MSSEEHQQGLRCFIMSCRSGEKDGINVPWRVMRYYFIGEFVNQTSNYPGSCLQPKAITFVLVILLHLLSLLDDLFPPFHLLLEEIGQFDRLPLCHFHPHGLLCFSVSSSSQWWIIRTGSCFTFEMWYKLLLGELSKLYCDKLQL